MVTEPWIKALKLFNFRSQNYPELSSVGIKITWYLISRHLLTTESFFINLWKNHTWNTCSD